MLQTIGISALVGGVIVALLWVVLWTHAFPGVWQGHGALTTPMFVIGAIGGGALPIIGMK